MKTKIVVTLQVEGFHNWEMARVKMPEVAFLSDRHRHMFHIKATKLVNHDDRDVEIIMMKNEIREHLIQLYAPLDLSPFGRALELGSKSCEMIAKELLMDFNLTSCEVLEDGENGAIVEI